MAKKIVGKSVPKKAVKKVAPKKKPVAKKAPVKKPVVKVVKPSKETAKNKKTKPVKWVKAPQAGSIKSIARPEEKKEAVIQLQNFAKPAVVPVVPVYARIDTAPIFPSSSVAPQNPIEETTTSCGVMTVAEVHKQLSQLKQQGNPFAGYTPVPV